MSFTDAIADFIRAMELEGVKPVEPIAQRLASGELIRFRADGDGRGRANSCPEARNRRCCGRPKRSGHPTMELPA